MKNLSTKSPLMFPIFAFLLISLFYVAESSPSDITRGSSLIASPGETNYLLSPSGRFAFGFKSLSLSDQYYKLGIWITNSSDKTLVWVPNPNEDEPFDKGSSIILNPDGVFMLEKAGFPQQPLLRNKLSQPAFFASMHDTGNLVIYNEDSKIIWQSFDHPTDTILPGQTLKSGLCLVAKTSDYYVTVEKYGDLFVSHKERDKWYYYWRSNTGNRGSPVVLRLDTTGRLYLVDWNLVIIKNFTRGEEHVGNTVYRATIDTDGIFRLYGESVGPEATGSAVLWHSWCVPCREQRNVETFTYSVFSIAFVILVSLPLCFICVANWDSICRAKSRCIGWSCDRISGAISGCTGWFRALVKTKLSATSLYAPLV